MYRFVIKPQPCENLMVACSPPELREPGQMEVPTQPVRVEWAPRPGVPALSYRHQSAALRVRQYFTQTYRSQATTIQMTAR